MAFYEAFKSKTKKLVTKVGEGNAFLVWVMGMYLEEADLDALASECLTDGSNDKKIDFIWLDRDAKRIVFCQGYYSSGQKDSAPSNKASDLNTAAAWLISGDTTLVPEALKPIIDDCRVALKDGDVETIDLLYVHNRPESINVAKELQTVASHVKKALGEQSQLTVFPKELGIAEIDNLFSSVESHIQVRDEVLCPVPPMSEVEGPLWKAAVVSVPGSWLRQLYIDYGTPLFSANYRGFLGINKRKKINSGIRSTAESSPENFLVFNNGVTLLTQGFSVHDGKTKLIGISIINGCRQRAHWGQLTQRNTTFRRCLSCAGSFSCLDAETIKKIVKFNNTQNAITSWDQYSNDGEQFRIETEFTQLGHQYSRKRGFQSDSSEIGIEQVAIPLLAFQGKFTEAIAGKNRLFDSDLLYAAAFSQKKARHILMVYALATAIDERRLELKAKSAAGTIIELEAQQLRLMRYLRFKNFLIAVTARCLESVIGQRVNLDIVAFTPAAATQTLIELAAAWSPVVEAPLSLVVTRVPPDQVGDILSQDGIIELISKDVNALAYAGRKHLPFGEFAKLVSVRG